MTQGFQLEVRLVSEFQLIESCTRNEAILKIETCGRKAEVMKA